jgi:hypothetical protein
MLSSLSFCRLRKSFKKASTGLAWRIGRYSSRLFAPLRISAALLLEAATIYKQWRKCCCDKSKVNWSSGFRNTSDHIRRDNV